MPSLLGHMCLVLPQKRGRIMGCVIQDMGALAAGRNRNHGARKAIDLQQTSPLSRRGLPVFTKNSECPISTSKTGDCLNTTKYLSNDFGFCW